MELKRSGTVSYDGCNVRFTEMGRWLVSQCGTVIGEVDTLAEVDGLIKRQREAVRERLAKVQAEAARRKAEREAERAMIETATKPEDEPIGCAHCPEKFSDVESLQSHFDTTHAPGEE
jgi:hypothetical protein